MNKKPIVSVVISFLNPGPWLAEAIDSILSQTYKNWEIVLVDDGSIGRDTERALAYAEKYPGKIKYIQHSGHANKGLPVSRNAGIAKSSGEFIAFLDADDYWLPEKLSRQLDVFEKFPEVSAICEASIFWYSWNNTSQDDTIQYIGAAQGIYYPAELMKALYPLGEGASPCPSGIIIKRTALQRCGNFEETFSGLYQLYEDQAFLSKLYSKEIIYVSDEANNLYRKRDNSMSSAATDLNIYYKVRCFYLEWLEKYFTASTNHNIKELIENFRNKLNMQKVVHPLMLKPVA